MRKRTQSMPMADAQEVAADRQTVNSLVRGLDLLRLLAKQEVLGTTDMAKLSGLSNSTVSRLCFTLTNLGYIDYLPDLGKYRLGDACLALGYLYMANDLVAHIARPLMNELSKFSGVPVCLGHRLESQIIYTARESVEDQLSLRLGVGSRVPIERTAMGHAYLAGADEVERKEVLKTLEATVPDMKLFMEPIERSIDMFNKTGFCINDRLWLSHIRAVAVPLHLRDSGKVVVFNCGGIADYLQPSFLTEEVGPRLVELVKRVETILEARGSAQS